MVVVVAIYQTAHLLAGFISYSYQIISKLRII